MSSRPELKLDWCSHAAAKYAVEHWHYSKSMPTAPHNRIGVWECGEFVGIVMFSRGATFNLGKPYMLKQTQCCELTRVALSRHDTPVSRIIRVAMCIMRKRSPGIRLVVSFADPGEGHHGGIYQACNWIFAGVSSKSVQYKGPDGNLWHPRMVKVQGFTTCYGVRRKTFKPAQCEQIKRPGKYRYLMPLDAEMRRQIEPLRQPYPKRVGSVDSDTPAPPGGKGRCESDLDALNVSAS